MHTCRATPLASQRATEDCDDDVEFCIDIREQGCRYETEATGFRKKSNTK
jgi:hypothetical protein